MVTGSRICSWVFSTDCQSSISGAISGALRVPGRRWTQRGHELAWHVGSKIVPVAQPKSEGER